MDKLRNFLKEMFPERIQMFDTRNFVGDFMITIYDQDGIQVDYCPHYEYVEIFGLSEEDFERINLEMGK